MIQLNNNIILLKNNIKIQFDSFDPSEGTRIVNDSAQRTESFEYSFFTSFSTIPIVIISISDVTPIFDDYLPFANSSGSCVSLRHVTLTTFSIRQGMSIHDIGGNYIDANFINNCKLSFPDIGSIVEEYSILNYIAIGR